MSLKFIIDNISLVDEAQRGLYKQIEGGKYQLDVDGAVDKTRLDEFRNNNVELKQQLEKLKDIDPVKYKELTAIQRKIEEKELLEKGEVDKLVELRTKNMKDDLQAQLDAANTELNSSRGQLSVLQINDVVKSAALKVGVQPTAVDDVINRANSVFKIEKGLPVPKNPDGTVIYDKSGDKPITVDGWLHDLKKVAPHLFVGSSGSGAGGGGGLGGRDVGSMSALEKITAGLNAGLTGKPPAGLGA